MRGEEFLVRREVGMVSIDRSGRLVWDVPGIDDDLSVAVGVVE